MVTCSSRHAKLWVRFPALHPLSLVRRLFALLAVVAVLPISVNAETYTAAGQKFVGNGSTFSSIGGYATSSMTFAGTGGIMLYNAFSNLDNQIAAVQASAVTTSSLSSAFADYFGNSGIFTRKIDSAIVQALSSHFSLGSNTNMYSLLSAVNQHTADTAARLTYNNTSAAGWLYAINSAMGTANSNLQTINGSIGITNSRIGASATLHTSAQGSTSVTSVLDGLRALSDLIYSSQYLPKFASYLDADGWMSGYSQPLPLSTVIGRGFAGLSTNLAGGDKKSTFVPLIGVEGPLQKQEISVDNLLDAITLVGTHLQNPLAKLQYVLADDDDISMKDAVKDNQQAVEDEFTGNGSGSIGRGDITDAAGISGGLRDTYGGAGSVGDAFDVMGASDTWSFFSSDVAAELDASDQAASQALDDEDPFAGFSVGEDGLYHLSPGSMFDVSSYLEDLK